MGIFGCQEEAIESTNQRVPEVAHATTSIPQEVIDAAIIAYGNDTLPAVTIALTYSRGDSAINLEDDWTYTPYSSPDPNCTPGEDSPYYVDYYRTTMLTTIDGFTFLEENDLCGFGNYYFDNRQGGWFDYVCGPQGFSVDYQGTPVIKLVRLWCE